MFKVGDRVKIKKDFIFDSSFYGSRVRLVAGLIGKIKSIYGIDNHHTYAVEFEKDIDGCHCVGLCEYSYGQVMKNEDIELAESRIRTKEELVMLYNELKQPYK